MEDLGLNLSRAACECDWSNLCSGCVCPCGHPHKNWVICKVKQAKLHMLPCCNGRISQNSSNSLQSLLKVTSELWKRDLRRAGPLSPGKGALRQQAPGAAPNKAGTLSLSVRFRPQTGSLYSTRVISGITATLFILGPGMHNRFRGASEILTAPQGCRTSGR